MSVKTFGLHHKASNWLVACSFHSFSVYAFYLESLLLLLLLLLLQCINSSNYIPEICLSNFLMTASINSVVLNWNSWLFKCE